MPPTKSAAVPDVAGVQALEPLPAEAGARLTEFARACKAAVRALTLYPPTHAAIGVSLARAVEAASGAAAGGVFRLTVLPDTLVLDGRRAARADPALSELAALLHQHLIGELRVQRGTDEASWRSFLLLIGRAPEDVRAEGGIARLWTGGQIEVREIDYREVLKERASGDTMAWETIVANCLKGEATDLDEEPLVALLALARDRARFTEFLARLREQTSRSTAQVQAQILCQIVHGIVELAARTEPEHLDGILRNLADAAERLPPDVMGELLARRDEAGASGIDGVSELAGRMSDDALAQFVAEAVANDHGATGRLAQAFEALVPDTERKRQILALAGQKAAQSVLGEDEGFPDLWKHAADMLTSYSDEPFVSPVYALELSGARRQAIDVERAGDDPPERIAAWLATLDDTALRALDLQLLLDLLAIETGAAAWHDIAEVSVSYIRDLVLVGDFEAAARLVAAVTRGGPTDGARTSTPGTALTARLIDADMLKQVAVQFCAADVQSVGAITRLCHALGPRVIKPLAEILAVEETGGARRHLRDVLIGFGAPGREAVEYLKRSPSPSVRRVAIDLLRAFGGGEALSELVPLLDDPEPHVQREAVSAIAFLSTDEAYSALERAITLGPDRRRQAVMNALGSLRDEKAVPLLCHLVRQTGHRGKLLGVYFKAIDGLGTVSGARSVETLKEALQRGEWWAPIRTARLRTAAAAALRKIGTPEAIGVLREAADRGPRGVRAAARAQLAEVDRR